MKSGEFMALKQFAGAGRRIRVMVVSLPIVGWGLRHLINGEAGDMEVVNVADSVAAGLITFSQFDPEVVLVDLDGEDGTESLTDLHAQTPAKVLALTGSRHSALHDSAILAGAKGVVEKREAPEVLIKALRKVHAGEMWIDRSATGRIFLELARQQAQRRRNPDRDKLQSLSVRERELVQAVAADPSAPGKVVASRLHISENTLRNHLTSIYAKLGVKNRLELYTFMQRQGDAFDM
jgi:two-component system, NarL family, nitrate/nitrite response regulator NarL